MKHFIYLVLLFAHISYAQENKDVTLNYRNGKPKIIVKYKNNDTLQRINYYKKGNVRDSGWYRIETFVAVKAEMDKHKGLQDSIVIKNEVGIGTIKKYYKKGQLQSLIKYAITETGAAKSYEYYKNGKLQSYKELPYGKKIYYKKNGKIPRYFNTNKGTQVYVPKEYKDQKHLASTSFTSRIKAKKTKLNKGNKKIELKAGALISLQLNSDSTELRNCLIEGFSGDSIYLSKFEYDLGETKAKLKYDSTFAVHIDQINSILYSKKNTKRTYTAASVFKILGIDIIIVPCVVLPILGGIGTLVNPIVLPIIASGIPMLFYSHYLYKKMVPKEYKMSEWKLVKS